jgi:hypothetical protein
MDLLASEPAEGLDPYGCIYPSVGTDPSGAPSLGGASGHVTGVEGLAGMGARKSRNGSSEALQVAD